MYLNVAVGDLNVLAHQQLNGVAGGEVYLQVLRQEEQRPTGRLTRGVVGGGAHAHASAAVDEAHVVQTHRVGPRADVDPDGPGRCVGKEGLIKLNQKGRAGTVEVAVSECVSACVSE